MQLKLKAQASLKLKFLLKIAFKWTRTGNAERTTFGDYAITWNLDSAMILPTWKFELNFGFKLKWFVIFLNKLPFVKVFLNATRNLLMKTPRHQRGACARLQLN